VLQAIASNKWLVIDEFNRADIDKAFGQLFTVLSDQPVILPFAVKDAISQEELPVSIVPPGSQRPRDTQPYDVVPSWRMIVTLNTRDRDLLFNMSYALMRRFAVIDIPSPSLLDYRELLKDKGATGSDDLDARLAKLIEIPYSRLGPAILLDCAKYARARLEMAGGTSTPLSLQQIMMGAIEASILPQMGELTKNQQREVARYLSTNALQADMSDAAPFFEALLAISAKDLLAEAEEKDD
jgi:hypothetical protein